MNNHIEMQRLVEELAREVNREDPVDFSDLPFDENTIWHIMSSWVVQKYSDLPEENSEAVYLATITKLVVENFTLNAKLLRKN